ncbi:acid phosphatase type 7-like isoform X1 [Liolophura sinensis]|uniref:acid phosphatase type 7-like isoform X1 n=1 Tax=Liolophura sinensis TaxID=3198878 RepID=UPI0031587D6B
MAILLTAVSTWTSVVYCAIFLWSLTYGSPPEDTDPKQVRLSFGETTRDVVVMAATKENCSARVMYGLDYFNLTTEVAGRGALFDQSKMNPKGLHFLHRIVLKNLNPGVSYYYAVHCDESLTITYGFKVPKNDTNWSPKFLVYGDMGIESPIVRTLEKKIQSVEYTAVLHLGDIAYQLESDGGMRGDKFMDMIEPIASRVPYLTTPGNHEVAQDTFVHYRYRFSTPTTGWPIPLKNMWYSIDIGPVHLISYNTEVFNMTDKQYIALQHDWLVSDLQMAKENRETVPWIVAFAHKPFYCSNSNAHDCTRENSVVRKNLEDLFFQYSVDLILNGQQHSYERLWPTYKGTVHADNYTDPTAPVSIISGTAGGSQGVDPMERQPGVWTAVRIGNDSMNSYGVLSVVNETHLHWEQISGVDDKKLDSFWISQGRHGGFVTVSPDEHSETNDGSNPSVHETHNTFSQQATKVVQHVKEIIKSNKPVAIGVASTVSVLLLIGCLYVIVRCRRRKSSPRRWEKLDYDKSFYSDVKTAEDDFSCDETEIHLDGNGTMPTSKLLSKSTV